MGGYRPRRPPPPWHRPGHPAAFYFQATARQAGRDPADATARLRRAAEMFRFDGVDRAANICSLFAHAAELYAAALRGDDRAWADAGASVKQFLGEPAANPLERHYRSGVEALGDTISLEAAEKLFRLVPYSIVPRGNRLGRKEDAVSHEG